MFRIKDMDDRIIPDIMNDLIIPQGSIPENFMFLSSLEVSQEGRCPQWWYLEDIVAS